MRWLGARAGAALRRRASAEAWRPMLRQQLAGLDTVAERLEGAAALFGAMGHGGLALPEALPGPSEVHALQVEHLHYGRGWVVDAPEAPARAPLDALAAGFIGAALEIAHGLEPGALDVEETACVAQGAPACAFALRRRAEPSPVQEPPASRLGPARQVGGLEEDHVEALADRFQAMLEGVSGDARGLVEAFGLLVTLTPTHFYNELSFEMLARLRQENPRLVKVSERMLYEAGRMCGFNTFGGVLRSPEWDAISGRAGPPEPRQVLLESCAIGRAFGFGRGSLVEYVPGQVCVFRAPMTYEGMYTRAHEAGRDRGACFLFAGAAEAMARLAEDVDWAQAPSFGPQRYEQLVRADEARWSAEQTRCTTLGDDLVEVVVRRR